MLSTYAKLLLNSIMNKLGLPKKQQDLEQALKNPNSIESITLSLQVTIIQMTQKIRELAIEAYTKVQEEITGRKLEKSTDDDAEDYRTSNGLSLPPLDSLKQMQDQTEKMQADLDQYLANQRYALHQGTMNRLYTSSEFKKFLSDSKLESAVTPSVLSKVTETLFTRGSFSEEQQGKIISIVGKPAEARSATAEAAKWDAGTQIVIIGMLKDAINEHNAAAAPDKQIKPTVAQLTTFSNKIYDYYQGNKQMLDKIALDITPASVDKMSQSGTFTPPTMQERLSGVLSSGGESLPWSLQTQLKLTSELRDTLVGLQAQGRLPIEVEITSIATDITNMIGQHYKNNLTEASIKDLTGDTVLKLKELCDTAKFLKTQVDRYQLPEAALSTYAQSQKAQIPSAAPAVPPPPPPPMPDAAPTRSSP